MTTDGPRSKTRRASEPPRSWRGLRVAVSGIRELRPDDAAVVRAMVAEVASDGPSFFIFGGARGTDTLALRAAAEAARDVERLVIVPGWMHEQPREAVEAMRECATEVRQMQLPVALPSSYRQRNEAMLDAAGALLAFSDGAKGGTTNTIASARRRGMSVRVVPVRRIGGNPLDRWVARPR